MLLKYQNDWRSSTHFWEMQQLLLLRLIEKVHLWKYSLNHMEGRCAYQQIAKIESGSKKLSAACTGLGEWTFHEMYGFLERNYEMKMDYENVFDQPSLFVLRSIQLLHNSIEISMTTKYCKNILSYLYGKKFLFFKITQKSINKTG